MFSCVFWLTARLHCRNMMYQSCWLACVVAVVIARTPTVSTQDLPVRTITHPGYPNIEQQSLVKNGDAEFDNDDPSRSRRAIKDKINLLGVIGQLYTEQKEDQEMAYQKLSMLISDSIAPEPSQQSTSSTTTAATSPGDGEDTTQVPGSSTTAAPFKATPSLIMSVIRSNLLGLRNLLQKEWRTSIQESNKNSAAAIVEFKNSVRPFLMRNGTASG